MLIWALSLLERLDEFVINVSIVKKTNSLSPRPASILSMAVLRQEVEKQGSCDPSARYEYFGRVSPYVILVTAF